MVAISTPAETRTLLENISWQTFKAMLTDMGSSRNTRLAYENGTLEIMAPDMPHENSNRVIEGFVIALCEEIGEEYKRSGSLTLTRDDLERGGEPDSSYYIQNEYRVRNKEKIDLSIDPPPDLVLEVEYSKPKVDKFKIYAAIGVPEFWRFNGSVLRIYVLNDGQYLEVKQSPTFGTVPVKEIPRFIQETRINGEMATTRAFRAWVREQNSSGG
ncbi:MAG: Uma2 family endonuclease [Nostocales cyanobacterium 94392]|nr:Uma2 family endonuclease [Nostocales cyanobacterium 94392]